MAPLLANATVSTTRQGAGLLSNVPWRIWNVSLENAVLPGNEMLLQWFRFSADLGSDVQTGDVVSGWNPLGLAIPPRFVVAVVHRVDGPLPHLTGVLRASGKSALHA